RGDPPPGPAPGRLPGASGPQPRHGPGPSAVPDPLVARLTWATLAPGPRVYAQVPEHLQGRSRTMAAGAPSGPLHVIQVAASGSVWVSAAMARASRRRPESTVPGLNQRGWLSRVTG